MFFFIKTKLKIIFTSLMPILLALTVMLTSFAESEYTINASDLVAESAILIDQDTGQILFTKNAQLPLYPASTTKILTAIIILEDLSLDQKITVTKDMEGVDGSGIALAAGEVLTVNELLHAMLMVSSNDSAEALAKTHSGTIEAFAKIMNERAAQMGAQNSNFKNPHGLPNPDHLSTAYDLAMIAKYAMKNETFREIVMTPRFEIPANAVQPEVRYLNHTNKFIPGVSGSNEVIDYRNQRVKKGYDLMTGIKSGYTTKALHCFVGASEYDDRRFISVIIKSQGENMYIDTRKLLDYGMFGTQTFRLYDEGELVTQKTLDDKRNTVVSLVSEAALSVDLPLGIDLSVLVKQETLKTDWDLPIEKGELLGNVSYYLNDVLVCETNLVSQDTYLGEDLITQETTFFTKEKSNLFTTKNIALFAVKTLIALFLWRTVMTLLRLGQIKKNRKKVNRYASKTLK